MSEQLATYDNDQSASGDGALAKDSAAATRPQVSIDGVENALLKGDLAKLSANERLSYYRKVCESVGLNPLTRPFEYIKLNGKLTLYAKRDAAEQLRRLRGISITKLEESWRDDIYIVRAYAEDESGRTDVATGAVDTSRSRGQDLANNLMKAETKAKRRVTLSIAGLGWLDETEIRDIPGEATEPVHVSHDTGEIHDTDYLAKIRQAKAWLAAKPDEALKDAFEQLRSKAGEWPKKYQQQVEQLIEKRKQACSQLPGETPDDDVASESEDQQPDEDTDEMPENLQ
jgi:hypothetical protein